MNNLKLLTAVLVFLTLLLIMVLLRSTDSNLFKRNAADALKAVEEITITPGQYKSEKDQYTLIVLDGENQDFERSLSISYEKLVEKETRLKLKAIEGKLLLYSDDVALAAQAWVILNQLDFDNVFILADGENPEVLKYKFRPDTLAGPESAQ